MDQPLQGKIILITGGASGIGLAVTKQAHSLGCNILVADLKTTPDFDAFRANKPNILYVQSDVTNWPSLATLFHACEQKWNDVPDAYAICAGVFAPPSSNFWDDREEEAGYMMVDVNVNHPVKLTRLAIRKSLGRGKRASVCIIASVAGIMGLLTTPLYSATKHAIVGFVKSLKDSEALTGVKVTALCPSGVWTPLFDDAKSKQYSIGPEDCLTPDTCATHLLELLQKKEYSCGSVVAVTLARTTVIPEWNVKIPEGIVTGKEKMDEGRIQRLMEPVKRVLEREKAKM